MSITSIKISLFSAVVIRISAYPADMVKPFILKTAKNKKADKISGRTQTHSPGYFIHA